MIFKRFLLFFGW
ncbi:hypothetical protein D043_0517A, partial [Vibrio parahaemolyticus EKP-021]